MNLTKIGLNAGISILLIGMAHNVYADALEECQKDIVVCDTAYVEQKKLVDKLDEYIAELEKANANTLEDLDREKREAAKFYHNPVGMGLLGVGAGAGAVGINPILLPIVAGVVLIAALFS